MKPIEVKQYVLPGISRAQSPDSFLDWDPDPGNPGLGFLKTVAPLWEKEKDTEKVKVKLTPIIINLEATGTDVSGRPQSAGRNKGHNHSQSTISHQKQHFSTVFKIFSYEGWDGKEVLWTTGVRWEMDHPQPDCEVAKKMDCKWWLLHGLILPPSNRDATALLKPAHPSGTGRAVKENILTWWVSVSQRLLFSSELGVK